MLQKRAAVLLYSPGTDTFQEDMTRNADRYYTSTRAESYDEAYFERFIQKPQKSQRTLEAWT